MKTKVIFCDVCKHIIYDENNISVKYRAKRQWYSFHESGWERIDLCGSCLNKIINAKDGEENG